MPQPIEITAVRRLVDATNFDGAVLELHYEREGFLPGHTHVIPLVAVWQRMAEHNLPAVDALRLLVLEAQEPGSPRLLPEQAAAKVRVDGLDVAAHWVPPIPVYVREALAPSREPSPVGGADRARPRPPGRATRSATAADGASATPASTRR